MKDGSHAQQTSPSKVLRSDQDLPGWSSQITRQVAAGLILLLMYMNTATMRKEELRLQLTLEYITAFMEDSCPLITEVLQGTENIIYEARNDTYCD